VHLPRNSIETKGNQRHRLYRRLEHLSDASLDDGQGFPQLFWFRIVDVLADVRRDGFGLAHREQKLLPLRVLDGLVVRAGHDLDGQWMVHVLGHLDDRPVLHLLGLRSLLGNVNGRRGAQIKAKNSIFDLHTGIKRQNNCEGK